MFAVRDLAVSEQGCLQAERRGDFTKSGSAIRSLASTTVARRETR